jgi:hypothetical protein
MRLVDVADWPKAGWAFNLVAALNVAQGDLVMSPTPGGVRTLVLRHGQGVGSASTETVTALTFLVSCAHCGEAVLIENQRTLAGREIIAVVACAGCGKRAKLSVAWVDLGDHHAAERKRKLREKQRQEAML